VRRILLSPAWWGRHVLLVVLVAAFVYLGRWQWHRAMAPTGSLQNLLYAIEWWVFGGLAVAGWVHLVRDEIKGTLPSQELAMTPESELPAFARQHRQPADDEASSDDVAADAELAAYNAYLAWLNEHPRR
jgi:DNA-binding transcriptional regulator of glucitol operon